MRKSLVAILTAGLLFLGVSPVWAAGQAMATLPAQQGEVVQVVVPEGEGLGEGELADVQGEAGPLAYVGYVLVRGLIGAVGGAAIGAFKSYVETGRVNVRDVAVGAGIGFIAGVTAGAGALIPKPGP